MAGSTSNPGQTVTRARGRFGTSSFGSQRRLCPAYRLARIFILAGELLAHKATVTICGAVHSNHAALGKLDLAPYDRNVRWTELPAHVPRPRSHSGRCRK